MKKIMHLIHTATRRDGVGELESGDLPLQTLHRDVAAAAEDLGVNLHPDTRLDVRAGASAAARRRSGPRVLGDGEQFGGGQGA